MFVKNENPVQPVLKHIYSTYLEREVSLTFLLPVKTTKHPLPVLWLNDGQDIPALELEKITGSLIMHHEIKPFITVGIHANADRMQEYGTLEMPDYENRGAKASLYADFIAKELVPEVREAFNVSNKQQENVIAGFSLGALSALDIGWNYPMYFGKIGVFSGSLWWRKRAVNRWYRDSRDRIMHNIIRQGAKREGLKFWFEAGTADELTDRNHNGLIDSLDDTVDMIKELTAKGYDGKKDIQFVVVKDGTHNQDTWKEVMPYFLKWAFGV
jgi:enterochelin esterase-like enzyme